MAVANTDDSQIFQHYVGSYGVQYRGGVWRLASASIRAVPEGTPPPGELMDPLGVLFAYFGAINSQSYARAYTLWRYPRQALGQSYGQFRQGFVTTRHVTFQTGEFSVDAAAGSSYAEIPVLIVAEQTDGTTRGYCGSYILRRANVPPFDRFGWRLQSADIITIAPVALGSPEAADLLATGCGE
jgi:hypothetical protein